MNISQFSNINPNPTSPPKVCVLAYEPLCTFEYGIAVEIFAPHRANCEKHMFDLKTVAEESGMIKAAGGIQFRAQHGLDELEKADLIVIPGWKSVDALPSKALLVALRKANSNGARIVSICSGAFVLAAAGLLDGKSATTHWRYSDLLAAKYPSINVEPNVLFIDEGDVLTSAGSTAGIDVCLHIIRQYYGQTAANKIARSLVVPAQREGGQAQFIPSFEADVSSDSFSKLLDTIRADLSGNWNVETMAEEANISPRTLLRRFKQQLGKSPISWLTHERLNQASNLLESTPMKIDQVAFIAGFSAPETFRLHFKRRYKISPGQYRAQFNIS